MTNTFLTAEWRKLILANYAIDKKILVPYLPQKTELDDWNDTCYASLVGFMFINTKIKGFSIPYHVHFEEVNLRFYVRYKQHTEWKRGVVFIKEIVPRPAITIIANTLYGEKYETLPMTHSWQSHAENQIVEYRWKKKNWHSMKVTAEKTAHTIAAGSEEEFITEHYWGYARVNHLKTTEYEVKHPRWEVYPVVDYQLDVNFETVYGKDFAFLNGLTPVSVFLAEGSEIIIQGGTTF